MRPVPPHGFPPVNMAALHAVGPYDIFVQRRQNSVNVPGVEPVIEPRQQIGNIVHVETLTRFVSARDGGD